MIIGKSLAQAILTSLQFSYFDNNRNVASMGGSVVFSRFSVAPRDYLCVRFLNPLSFSRNSQFKT